MQALPALESETYDGWVHRAAGGYTGRANSAAPLDPGELDPAEKISTPKPGIDRGAFPR